MIVTISRDRVQWQIAAGVERDLIPQQISAAPVSPSNFSVSTIS
jgi:hypothetical protein